MRKIEKLKKNWHFWKRRISAVLACIIVFVTVYAMVLPAITLDQNAADQEEGLVLEEGTDAEPDQEGTGQEEPGFSDEEDVGFEEEDTESHTEDTWAMAEGPVTLQWPAEPEDAEEAEEAVFYDESGEEIDYSVEATFGEDSGLPADVILQVAEIKAGTEEYEAYHKSALEAVRSKGGDETEISYARFFDITFLTADGEIIEPTGPVSILIRYKDEKELKAEAAEDLNVVHFALEDQKEQKNLEDLPQPEFMDIETEVTDDQVESITFGSESFSVYGVVGTYTVEVDAEEGEGGQHASFSHSSSLKGGDSILLSDLLEEAWPDREDLRIGNVADADAEEASADGDDAGSILKVSFNEAAGDYEITAHTEREEDLSGQKGSLRVRFTDGNTALFRITISGTPEIKTDLAVISSADGSYLPESASGSAEEVPMKDISDLAAGIAEKAGDETVSRVFDISLDLPQGEQEAYEGGFQVKLTLPEEVKGRDFRLYHIHDGKTEELNIEKTGSEPDEAGLETVSAVQFVTESFSEFVLQYTVDFHWEVDGKEYQLSFPGGGYLSFTKLMEAVGAAGNSGKSDSSAGPLSDGKITILNPNDIHVSEAAKRFVANVVKVEFSSPNLLSVSKVTENTTVGNVKDNLGLAVEYSAGLTEEDIAAINSTEVEAGDWALISLKAFETAETLTVTMKNGDVFVIKVTDARVGNELNGKQFVIVSQNNNLALTADSASEGTGFLSANNVTGNGNQIWTLEYSSNSGQYGSLYRLKSVAQNKYIDIDQYGRISLTANASDAADFIIDKENNTYQFQSFLPPDFLYSRYLNTADINGNTWYGMGFDGNQRFVMQEAQTSDKKGDWLLFLDEEQDDIYIHVGDTITLRPYDKWTWKNSNNMDAQYRWKFDNVAGAPTNWDLTRYGTTNEAQSSKATWQYQDENNKVILEFKRHVKYDTELLTRYWSIQGEAKNPGEYVLENTANNHQIRVHVLPADDTSHQMGSFTGIDRIKVNLFDYDKLGLLDPSDNSNLNYNGTLKHEAINIDGNGDLRPLHFTSSGGGSGINDYTRDTTNPDIVAPTLVNGFPVLNEDGSSLDYLFDTSKTTWSGGKNNDAIIAYPNLTGLFQQDTNGYYYYNSNSNYAYYNPAGGNKKITLYEHTYTQCRKNGLFNSKPIGFFPFHDYDSTHDLSVNQNKNLNHHLGMSMEVTFALPAGKTTKDGKHITFDFTGDDDMWVFVDDSLALDVGGVHQPIYRKVDFTDASQFVPGREYTLRVFYLERGGCDSNCAIRFNLPLTIGSADIRVVKEKKKDDAGEETVFLPGAKFGLWENENCTGDPLRTEDSKESGVVLFDRVPIFEEGQVYYMKEMEAPAGYYVNDTIYKVTAVKDTDGNFSFVVTEKENETANLDTTEEAPHSPIIYDEAMKPIALTVEKQWVGGAPENAEITFEVKRYKSYDGYVDNSPCTLEIYRYKNGQSPVKETTRYYKPGTTATVSWKYSGGYYGGNTSVYGDYNSDKSNTWQKAGRSNDTYSTTVGLSQAGETTNIYLRDENIGRYDAGVTNISVTPSSNTSSTGTQEHVFADNERDDSYHGPTKKLNKDTGWTWTFDEQPAYFVRADGIVEYYTYYIVEHEEDIPSGYHVAYDSMTGEKISGSKVSETRVITNYKNEVYVEKRWYNENGTLLDPQPTDAVTVTLSSTNNGQINGDAAKSITAQSRGVWTVEDNAEKLYTASETALPAYETTYTFKDVTETSERTEGGVHRAGTIYVNNRKKPGALKLTKVVQVDGDTPSTDEEKQLVNGNYIFSVSCGADIIKYVQIIVANGVPGSYKIADTLDGLAEAAEETGTAAVVTGLPEGDYVISEIEKNGLTLVSAARSDNDAAAVSEEKNVTVHVTPGDTGAGQTKAQAVFTNNYPLSSLDLAKIVRVNEFDPNSDDVEAANKSKANGTYTFTIAGEEGTDTEGHTYNVSVVIGNKTEGAITRYGVVQSATVNGESASITSDGYIHIPKMMPGKYTVTEDDISTDNITCISVTSTDNTAETDIDNQKVVLTLLPDAADTDTKQVAFTNNYADDSDEDIAYISVKKTFIGITAGQIPDNFNVKLKVALKDKNGVPIIENGQPVVKEYVLKGGTSQQSGVTFKDTSENGNTVWNWRVAIHGLTPQGYIEIEEADFSKTGYEVTTSVNGTPDSISTSGTVSSSTVVQTTTYVETSKNSKIFPVYTNDERASVFVARMVPSQNALVISKHKLNLSERAALEEKLRNMPNATNWITEDKPAYFSFEDAENNKIVARDRLITYRDKTDGTGEIEFTAKRQWDMVATFIFDYVPGHPADFNFVNDYTETGVDLDIVKVNAKDMETPLKDARFTLKKLDPDGNGTYLSGTEAVEKTSLPTDDEGKTIITGIISGYYEITETAVPDGYVIVDEGKFYIKVSDGVISRIDKAEDDTSTPDVDEGAVKNWPDMTDNTGKIRFTGAQAAVADNPETLDVNEGKEAANAKVTVGNTPGSALPNTGGPGSSLLYLFAIMFISISCAGLVMKKHRRAV